jgi:hypothetical protein
MVYHILSVDPKTIIAALALIVSLCSLAVSWRSGGRASRALKISESQEKRRQPSLGVYLAKAYRQLIPGKQLFGFLVSVTNPSDINNSIARAELQITYLLNNDVKAICRISHNHELAEKDRIGEPQEASVFAVPARIDAHQTLFGWFLFALDNNVIGEGTVDSHSLLLEDTHDITTDSGPIMVREWTSETPQGRDRN